MRYFILAISTSFCFMSGIIPAQANPLKFSLKAEVPVECFYETNGHQLNGTSASIAVLRHCNTPHRITIQNRNAKGLEYKVNYQGALYNIPAGQSVSLESKAVFDRHEHIDVSVAGSEKNADIPDLLFTIRPF